uniref:PDZ domain-containing protein n=1 Tax=Marmota marmota marmota TaxID=9994 RepID=A0A8C5YZZ7_MARMA
HAWLLLECAEAAWMLLGYTEGVWALLAYLRTDYIIKEKTVLLQKKDSEGFGFVLRGAKAQTPIEEFTPTPAFPALQYLESVDEGGVAWRAGLRMGDFLIEVNGQNVVKVGHRQVVNMIRQGGNTLMVKVVMVTRHPDMDEAVHKKAPQQAKRLPPPAISLRSKSMTSELEEMGEPEGLLGLRAREGWGGGWTVPRVCYGYRTGGRAPVSRSRRWTRPSLTPGPSLPPLALAQPLATPTGLHLLATPTGRACSAASAGAPLGFIRLFCPQSTSSSLRQCPAWRKSGPCIRWLSVR